MTSLRLDYSTYLGCAGTFNCKTKMF